jgi:hypothetical protein
MAPHQSSRRNSLYPGAVTATPKEPNLLCSGIERPLTYTWLSKIKEFDRSLGPYQKAQSPKNIDTQSNQYQRENTKHGKFDFWHAEALAQIIVQNST